MAQKSKKKLKSKHIAIIISIAVLIVLIAAVILVTIDDSLRGSYELVSGHHSEIYTFRRNTFTYTNTDSRREIFKSGTYEITDNIITFTFTYNSIETFPNVFAEDIGNNMFIENYVDGDFTESYEISTSWTYFEKEGNSIFFGTSRHHSNEFKKK